MKCFRLCCLSLSVAVLLSLAFSITANAEVISIDKYYIGLSVQDEYGTLQAYTDIHLQDGTYDFIYEEFTPMRSGGEFKMSGKWTIYPTSGILIEPDLVTTVTLDQFYFNVLYKFNNKSVYVRDPNCRILVFYSDGAMEYIDCTSSMNWSDLHVEFTFTPIKSVTHFEVIFEQTYKPDFSFTSVEAELMAGEFVDDGYGHAFTVTIETKEATLLGGIKDFLSSILDFIKGIGNGVANLVELLVQLPSKIGEAIVDGISMLFVPSDTYFEDFMFELDLISEIKFGALWQVKDILFEDWERIENADETDTIHINEVSIPLPDNNEFSFGGYDVKVVPDGFEDIALACKYIVAISCSVLFINAVRKRYDDVFH